MLWFGSTHAHMHWTSTRLQAIASAAAAAAPASLAPTSNREPISILSPARTEKVFINRNVTNPLTLHFRGPFKTNRTESTHDFEVKLSEHFISLGSKCHGSNSLRRAYLELKHHAAAVHLKPFGKFIHHVE
jgi:hypothetical protein